MTKTVLVKAPVTRVFGKAVQWLSLHDLEIAHQVQDQLIVVRPANYVSAAVAGCIFLLAGIIPGVAILATSVWTMELRFEASGEECFVRTKGGPKPLVRELAGIMSFVG